MDKPAVLLLLKKVMQDSKGSSEEGDYAYSESFSSEEGKRQAAKELLEAIKSSNLNSMVNALSNFMSLCNSDKTEMED